MPDLTMIRGGAPRSTAVALLNAGGLPFSDLTDEQPEHFFFGGSDGAPTGLVGLEIYGTDALLRSLVVGGTDRKKGMGSALVQHAEDYTASRNVRAIYLLTTTAEAFFERLGYERVARTQGPASIHSTREFLSLCPASATFMVKRL
jgi:amino-acid N-acetyltransferase